MTTRTCLLVTLTSISLVSAAPPPSPITNNAELIRTLEPLSVRGVNYYPRETSWGGMWTKTPREVWERDMALAASLHINTVRTFVPFSSAMEQDGLLQHDGAPAPAYLEKIGTFLAAAWQHRIRAILCFEFSQSWLAQPDAGARCRRALSAVVTAHREDGRVLLWDVMNEPEDDAKWTDGTRAYLRAALPLVKQLDPHHLTTVGLTWRIDRLVTVGMPNVLQYHEYSPKARLFQEGAARVRQDIASQHKVGGQRPLLIGEFGMNTARDPKHGVEASLRVKLQEHPGTEAEQARIYEIVLAAAEKERVAGALPWCLHDYPVQNPNESHFGLVRGDGTLKPAALLLRDTFGRWSSSRPSVGAIRWDAWSGGRVTDQVERTLGPAKYHDRLPWFANVTSEHQVRIDGSQPGIMEQEIDFAANAGLDYWAFLLYPESDSMSLALNQYRKSPQRRRLNFCVILHNAFGVAEAAWPRELARVVSLLKEPGYQTVLGNRPLVFEFQARLGGQFPRQRFAEFRRAAQEAGLNPYCVFMGWNPAADFTRESVNGFDAVSAYALGSDLPTFAQLARQVEQAYWQKAAEAKVPFVPLVTTGWDKRPRKDHPVSWEKNQAYHQQAIFPARAEPREIASHLERALAFVGKHSDCCAANTVIVYAWNEYDEGGWLAPTWTPSGQANTTRLSAVGAVLSRRGARLSPPQAIAE